MENASDRLWNESEIKELIELAQYLRQENEELQAKMIMMNAKLTNEEKKVKWCRLQLSILTNNINNNNNNSNNDAKGN